MTGIRRQRTEDRRQKKRSRVSGIPVLTSVFCPLSSESGFTLFEVLVALTIMALALAALLRVSGLAAENSAVLRDRMQAQWVAESQLALLQAKKTWPLIGRTQGTVEQNGRIWHWLQHVSATENKALRKVEVSILAPQAESYRLAVLVGFFAAPTQFAADAP